MSILVDKLMWLIQNKLLHFTSFPWIRSSTIKNSLLRLSELVENNQETFYCGHNEAFDQVSSPVFAVRNVQAKLDR